MARAFRLWPLGCAAVLCARLAQAAPAVSLVVDPAGCPNGPAIARAIAELLPGVLVGSNPADGSALPVAAWDLGARYRFRVGTRERQIEDPARRCDERARAVAVVTALVLEPPQVDLPALPTADQDLLLRASPPPPRHAYHLDIEMGPLAQIAPATDGGTLVQGGLSLRAVLGGRTFGLSLGAALLSTSDLDFGTMLAHLSRVPFDIGLRATLPRPSYELSWELGAAPALIMVSAQSLPASTQEARLDLGLRAASVGRLFFSEGWALFGSFETDWNPRSYVLTVEPNKIIGKTPALWLGMTAGLARRFD